MAPSLLLKQLRDMCTTGHYVQSHWLFLMLQGISLDVCKEGSYLSYLFMVCVQYIVTFILCMCNDAGPSKPKAGPS